MAKRIVRLTESGMNRLVRRIIKEAIEVGDDGNMSDYGEYNYGTDPNSGAHIIENSSKHEVDRFLKNLPENARFIVIHNCEYADFSNINLCAFPKLIFVNLKGTENNIEEQQFASYCIS
jgi:hypothetical protein